jgi:hypothetical protein
VCLSHSSPKAGLEWGTQPSLWVQKVSNYSAVSLRSLTALWAWLIAQSV